MTSIECENGEIWDLSKENYYYCCVHGKCPAIIDKTINQIEITKTIGTNHLFFCEKCGMVKIINVWGNSTGLMEAKLQKESIYLKV